MKEYIYFVNHSKREYYIKPKYNKNKWLIHVLPYLLVDNTEDNYPELLEPFVGRWCGDIISLENQIPEGMTNLNMPVIDAAEL
ncbi:MAG: hypothetical protein ACRCTZ_14600 [Sarcina sp.]